MILKVPSGPSSRILRGLWGPFEFKTLRVPSGPSGVKHHDKLGLWGFINYVGKFGHQRTLQWVLWNMQLVCFYISPPLFPFFRLKLKHKKRTGKLAST